ncbi:MAG: hypothetical protein AAFX99_23905, partial [Myxococcota bacterium]
MDNTRLLSLTLIVSVVLWIAACNAPVDEAKAPQPDLETQKSALCSDNPSVTILENPIVRECTDEAGTSVFIDYNTTPGAGADCSLVLEEFIERFEGGVWVATPQTFSYPNTGTQVRVRVRDPLSGLLGEALSSVQIEDTRAPFVDYGTNLEIECTSPDLTPFTPNTATVRDACTSDVTITTNLDQFGVPGDYKAPYGLSEITVTATDNRGFTASDSFNVRVIDTTPPVVDAGRDYRVPQRGDCDLSGTNDGTLVTLPLPSVTDVCSTVDNINLINNITGNNERTVCLANGATTTIQWTAFDRNGQTATDVVEVTVTTSTLGVNVTQAPTGWVNDLDPEVRAEVLGSAAPVDWYIIGDLPATTLPGTGTSVNAVFANEAAYCPLYVSAATATGVGINDDSCFGVERTDPLGVFNFSQNWFDYDDPTIQIPADSTDSQTWPIYFEGERIRAEISANDTQGNIRSGLARVQLIVDPSTPDEETVIDWTGTGTGRLSTGPMTMDQLGCNTGSSICDSSNRINLAELSTGDHTIELVVTDFAGNESSEQWYLRLKNFGGALDDIQALVTGLINSPTTLPSQRGYLEDANTAFASAQRLFINSPGYAFLLSRKAWLDLDEALASGADPVFVTFIQNLLARAIRAEVRRLVDVTDARDFEDWEILND